MYTRGRNCKFERIFSTGPHPLCGGYPQMRRIYKIWPHYTQGMCVHMAKDTLIITYFIFHSGRDVFKPVDKEKWLYDYQRLFECCIAECKYCETSLLIFYFAKTNAHINVSTCHFQCNISIIHSIPKTVLSADTILIQRISSTLVVQRDCTAKVRK